MLRLDRALLAAVAVFTATPAHSHGVEAFAYLAGVFWSVPVVLILLVLVRPGWRWAATTAVCAIAASLAAGLIRPDNFAAWLNNSEWGIFSIGFVPAVGVSIAFLIAVRTHKRRSTAAPNSAAESDARRTGARGSL